MALDSVANAEATPEREQPYEALGLKTNEYEEIKSLLGRRPTSGELAMYSVMWSEHCSYKSSKVHLRQFGQKVNDTMRKHLMVGMGENAGVVDIGEGWAVTFKIESHNHPSFIEPFQGAATGVGGIVRATKIFTSRARVVQETRSSSLELGLVAMESVEHRFLPVRPSMRAVPPNVLQFKSVTLLQKKSSSSAASSSSPKTWWRASKTSERQESVVRPQSWRPMATAAWTSFSITCCCGTTR
jgi:hypothetical protein